MGRLKASPAGTATANVVMIGFIPKAFPRIKDTGSTQATVATLLIPSVSTMLMRLIAIMKT